MRGEEGQRQQRRASARGWPPFLGSSSEPASGDPTLRQTPTTRLNGLGLVRRRTRLLLMLGKTCDGRPVTVNVPTCLHSAPIA
jgi:hypothetical protein